jgi:molybdopterin/thiamine biosynthesis adenylyltransferase
MTRLEKIVGFISSIENIEITSPLEQNGEVIGGVISLTEQSVTLSFSVKIFLPYPLQFHGSETIRFVNEELKEYNHVNADGSICVHTMHSPSLEEKLLFDFYSLREWIKNYYIEKRTDAHYEHIVVPHDRKEIFLFTEVDHKFIKNEFGSFKYSKLATGKFRDKEVQTYIVQEFKVGAHVFKCHWSKKFQDQQSKTSIYIFIENPPVKIRRFAFEDWQELAPFLSQDVLTYLTTAVKGSNKKSTIPILVGYNISDQEIHWQAILLSPGSFPLFGVREEGTKKYDIKIKSERLIWGETRNTSYRYFFGRGSLNKLITEANVLVIGVGALGSILAQSLVRGGLKKISLADHDIKEPENVCRSDYHFQTGVTAKVLDLMNLLQSVSPFVEVTPEETLMTASKFLIDQGKYHKAIKDLLNEFDIIFDCSTDNDVAYLLDKLELKSTIFNLSITNEAKELICVVSPNLYSWLKTIFAKFPIESADLYNPTGCWDPTFKASYNDIAVLLQYAIKHINMSFEKKLQVRNFYLSSAFDTEFTIKLNQF